MAQQKQIRGSQSKDEIREESIVRDTRGVFSRFGDWMRSPSNMTTFVLGLAVVAFLFPAIADACLVVSILAAWYGLSRPEVVPLKLPMQSALTDPHERNPAGGVKRAEGIFFIGNELRTGKEVWLTNSDCRQHFLVLGTTGAGKTETLLGFAANAVSWGSGFLFCDGKGDVSLYAKVYAMCRRFGREDDLLVLNYMTGNTDVGLSYGEKRSNTLNPFATGSADGLTQMVVSLMDETGGDGAMWKGRATAMFTGVMRALTWLREQQLIDLNVSEIRDHLQLKRIIDLATSEQYANMPPAIRKSVKSYLTSLPGYKESSNYNQAPTTLDQHGYLEMQFTKILGSLADVYGHIFQTPYAEVDMADVVLNRRILVIMLPALEKSKDEIANLGKIVVATLRGMMGGTLGNKLEGDWEPIVENRPTNSPSPFLCILDEVGYYMVDGMELMAAQARSLGFSLVFAGQDINAMKRLNEKVFGSVQGNTNTKIIMRTEDPDTAKIAIEAGGKTYRAQIGGYEGQPSEVASKSYFENREARLEAVDRVNPRDLKDQDEGEMHIFHKDWMVRAKSFYAAPESSINRKALRLRPNHFITVAKPSREDLESQQKLPEIVERLVSEDFAAKMKAMEKDALANLSDAPAEVGIAARTYAALGKNRNKVPSSVEAACVVFQRIIESNQSVTEQHSRDIRSRTAAGRGWPTGDDEFEGVPAGSRRPPHHPFAINDIDPDEDDHRPRRGGVREPDFVDPRGAGGDFARRDGFAVYEDDDHADGFDHRERRSGAQSGVAMPPKPHRKPKYRKDVPHGVAVDQDGVHGMAGRISNNKAVMDALASLDFDEKEKTSDMVNSDIEEAMQIAGDEDDDWGAPPLSAIEEAASSVASALPSFEDEGEEDGSVGDDDETLTSRLLGFLLDDEDEEEEDR